MTRMLINGIHGRVGRTIISNLHQFPGIQCTGGCDIKTEPIPGFDIPVVRKIEKIIGRGDVIVDFSTPKGTLEKLNPSAKAKIPLIIGTTGFSDIEKKKISATSKKIPIVFSSNFSIGANLLFREASLAAGILDESFDIEIIEHHHKFKKDAPSGTALKAGEEIAQSRKKNLEAIARFGRGCFEPRQKGEMTFHSIRGGHIVGEHTILFLGEHETFEITHRAYSREVFLPGLMKAIQFVIKKSSGLYDMLDVLSLR